MAKRVSITGDKRLDKALAELGGRDSRRAGRAAARAGVAVIGKAIRTEVPIGETKTLKKGIGWRVGKAKRGANKGITEAKAGTNVGKKRGKRAFHAHLVALGTKQRTTSSGANRGTMPANDFVERGFNKSSGEAKNTTMDRLAKEINKAARRKT